MRRKEQTRSTSIAWAHFRFSVIGSLLAAPPARGQLKAEIANLAEKQWLHPVTGEPVQFSASTIERWYYQARRERNNPVDVLRPNTRMATGSVAVSDRLVEQLAAQYGDHPDWSYQLHYDNLEAFVTSDPSFGTLCSYSTVRRYMQNHGMVRTQKVRSKYRPGELRAARRRQSREIRSYEAEYVGSLWHLDFHHGSLQVLRSNGQWQRPLALGVLDDHSRLCCHLQWYLSETTEDLVHGVSQAIQKRGLPRALLTDNGAAMLAEEFTQGLLRLSILHEKTLPYSPYQNGKQESFWATLEGRLMKMLDGYPELTLGFLNEATQAWVEVEYNRAIHREISVSPVQRFANSNHVLRKSPSSVELRNAFRLESSRKQRRSDGTVSIDGQRFEIPARFRHFRKVAIRYARWDLSRIDLVDSNSGTILAPIYPLDRTANADGRRGVLDSEVADAERHDNVSAKPLPPLLQKILDEHAAKGSPPAYLPKNDYDQEKDSDSATKKGKTS